MEQKDFHGILKKYLRGEASPEEIRMIDSWYRVMGREAGVPEKEEELLENKYWTIIDGHVKKNQGSGITRRMISWYSIGIAACVVLAISSIVYIVDSATQEAADPLAIERVDVSLKWNRMENASAVAQQFFLPDGSSVTLEPQSQIRISSAFNESKREVFLEGEGFFDVVRNEQCPFLVHANDVTTKVLGTSFSIKAFENDTNVIVAVKTGSVSVYTASKISPDKKDEVILTPNQKIIYDRHEEKVSRQIVETPQPILPADEIVRMRFEEAPVKEIFKAIERIYGVDIVFDEALFSSCTLTTSVSEGGLYNRLDIITSALGSEYTIEENRIVIIGSGCD